MKQKQKKCCGKCAAKKTTVKRATIGRTARLELKMTPGVKARSLALIAQISALKGEKVEFAAAWEHIILPILEQMTSVAMKKSRAEKKAAKANKKASDKKAGKNKGK